MQQLNIKDQLALAQQAASGDTSARTRVNQLAHPIINYQTRQFCKRFCRENQYRYKCTLNPSIRQAIENAMLCEWGNASYGWMLDDLSNSRRLLKYEGRNGASLFDYLYQIGNSLPFYERWKDWRFGRRLHVPTYIQALGPDAARTFTGLRANESIESIAQKLARPLAETEQLCQQIIMLLTQKRRLHLLNPPVNISLTESAENNNASSACQLDIADYDEAPEVQEEKRQLNTAWKKLSAVEQFVIEALIIEEQDARHVLQALQTMDVSIKKGIAAKDTSVQQLYYFRRKTLAKLAELMK